MAEKPPTLQSRIMLKAFTLGMTPIEVNPEIHAAAVEGDRLDREYDVYLSDMPEETVIVHSDGTVNDPYGQIDSLMDFAVELLEAIPFSDLEIYLEERRTLEANRAAEC